MRSRTRSLTWRGQVFRFQCLRPDAPPDAALWAVSRHGEFIGTMPCPAEVTTKDFDVRGCRWLAELLAQQ